MPLKQSSAASGEVCWWSGEHRPGWPFSCVQRMRWTPPWSASKSGMSRRSARWSVATYLFHQVEQTVLASRNGLSREEVFNIVVDRNYEANSK
jgi:hypothetical protein